MKIGKKIPNLTHWQCYKTESQKWYKYDYLDQKWIGDHLFRINNIYQRFFNSNISYTTHVKTIDIVPPCEGNKMDDWKQNEKLHKLRW